MIDLEKEEVSSVNCIICDDGDYHNDPDNYVDGVFQPPQRQGSDR